MQPGYKIAHIHQQKQQQDVTAEDSIPLTQQFFQHQHQHHHHHFPVFSQQPFTPTNSKLGLNENNRNTEEVALLGGSEQFVPSLSLPMPHCWKYTDLLNRSTNKRSNEEDEELPEMKQGKYSDELLIRNLENKFRVDYGELEAIYRGSGIDETNETGSGYALMGENLVKNASFSHSSQLNSATRAVGLGHGAEASIGIGEEPLLRKVQKGKKSKKMECQLGSLANFFERLVKQLMDHQEGLHRRFLETIEKLNQEGMEREKAWRQQQLEKYHRETTARTHNQVLASSRDATIVSYLEKITSQNINLPTRMSPTQFHPLVPTQHINEVKPMNTNKRWPKAEVEALIRIRSSFQLKFQEQREKGIVWEEISNSMGSMGYHRTAQKCKEKWENINRYFKKAKQSSNQHPQQYKTCLYFKQLDQLCSNSFINGSSSSSSSSSSSLRSELQAASNVGAQGKSILPIGNFKCVDTRSHDSDFNIYINEKIDELQQGCHGEDKENHQVEEEDID